LFSCQICICCLCQTFSQHILKLIIRHQFYLFKRFLNF
jgi:hypothetical protein